jgi:hypothetical protein
MSESLHRGCQCRRRTFRSGKSVRDPDEGIIILSEDGGRDRLSTDHERKDRRGALGLGLRMLRARLRGDVLRLRLRLDW